ncbi:SAD1/UNC-84 domain protein 1 [Heracleum sosnowskyi]|uniref:SAD1/UNC-84 domain protein 1 n=1 Tax=Heracleum sosnowskyi TaxID=360622 RepID=A0AAD8H5Z7_9APIA|nr:SAD1/UNC-84 domain protein 1 [Heracleum sosnowskyi]
MAEEVQVTRGSNHSAGATTKSYRIRRKGNAVKLVLKKYMFSLVLLAGLLQIVWTFYSSNVNIKYDNFNSRIAEVAVFVSKNMNMMQVQVDVADQNVMELEGKVFGMGSELEKLGRGVEGLGGRIESLEKYLSGNELLSKAEFDEFFDEYKKAKGNLDEVRVVAREIVMGEIEKHVADGLGRVDYALASGGGHVTRHSKARGSVWFSGIGWNGVHVDAVKMLRPSFGEPGECFALNGSSGFVEIKLRKAIVPEAVTLEHVAKSVAYDRSSAPKDCKVSGWFRGQETDLAHNTEKMCTLAKFTYDLKKSNAQTFDVSLPSGLVVVDMIRLDFASNHGKASHTSIYRFRVHGH